MTFGSNSAGIYLLKVNMRNTQIRCEILKVNNKDTRTNPLAAF